MNDSFGRAVGTCIVGLGLLAFVIAAPASDTGNGGAGTGSDANAQPALSTATAVSPSANAAVADAVIASWPDQSSSVAKAIIDKYGQPSEVSNSFLVWNDNGPWKQTIVYRDGVQHNFPVQHVDVLRQTISYKVPVSKFNDLARFDGSVIADRTSGTLSSTSDREDMNFLALNLANDIIKGHKTVEEARRFDGRTATLAMTGKSSAYTEGLLFKVNDQDAADPDQAVIQKPAQPQNAAPPSPY